MNGIKMTRRLENNLNNRISVALSRKAALSSAAAAFSPNKIALSYEKAKQEIAVKRLYNYLRDCLYNPSQAFLDVEKLPDNLKDLGSGIQYFTECVTETQDLAHALSRGDLNSRLPPRGNEIAAPLKSLHASLKHLSWQAEQIAFGDYSQRVDFMGDFSNAFNMMVKQLAERQKKLENEIDQIQNKTASLEKTAYHDSITQLYNRAYGMLTLDNWVFKKKSFNLIFVDLDNLKYINDEFGHSEGDIYIMNAAKHLSTFLNDAIVCRIGGDEFMLLATDITPDKANEIMTKIDNNFSKDEYLKNKTYSYSISFGIVTVNTDNKMSSSEILSIADKKMYENKRKRKKERK